MKCPVDQTQLAITDRQGVEVDYCPTCRGVWLDRGELDKLIERSASFAPQENRRQEHSAPEPDNRYRGDRESHGHDNGHKGHKKESFLGDFFDF